MKSTKNFIRSVVYAAESSKNYVDTRIKIYKNLKRKKSMAIPPDPDSVELAIKTAHLQTFTWLPCSDKIIQTLNPEEFGLKLTDGELKVLWFNGDQLPPSITRRRQGKQTDGNDADSDRSDPDDRPSKSKPTVQTSLITSKEKKQITRKKKKRYKKKGNETKDKLLPSDDSSEEAYEELISVVNSSTMQHR